MGDITRAMLLEMEAVKIWSIPNLEFSTMADLETLTLESLQWLEDRVIFYAGSGYHSRNYPRTYNILTRVQLPRIQSLIQTKAKES